MALLSTKLYLNTMFILCIISLSECNQFRKLKQDLLVMKGKLTSLENKVYEDEVTFQFEIEQIWRLLNSSKGGIIGIQHENEANDLNVETIESVIRHLEERDAIITKGFTSEKAELRKRVEAIESEIVAMRNQQIIELTNVTKMADKFMFELYRTVDDKLDQSNSNLEENMELMEIKHSDLVNSLSLKVNKTLFDIGVKIEAVLENVRKAQEVTESKTVQLETMIKNVNDFDENRKRIEKLEDMLMQETCLKKNGVKFESSCYLVSSSTATWQQAVGACSKMGARLVEVNSDDENDFLTKNSRSVAENVWLGASDLENFGSWKWYTSKESLFFPNWYGRVSDNCLSLFTKFAEWGAVSCNNYFLYICEFTF